MEKITTISNTNTMNWRSMNNCSRAFFNLSQNLNNSGMELIFINQNENYVYFKIKNNINKYISHIIDLTYNDLLSLGILDIATLKDRVWNKEV